MKNTNKTVIFGPSFDGSLRSFMVRLAVALAMLLPVIVLKAQEYSVEEWMARQNWFANLEASFPAGVTLSLTAEEGEDPPWEGVRIREVHSPDSGADPNVSPTVGFFRVTEDRQMVEWLDPVSGEWNSLAAFLRAYRSNPEPAKPAGVKMTGKVTSWKTGGENKPGNVAEAGPVPAHPRQLTADLDGDGQLELVRWEPLDFFGSDKFFSLAVLDHDQSVLWEGPKDRSMENAYIFFDSHFGSSFPQLLFDVDADGSVELLAPEPQSDVSATFFRRIRWNNGSFQPLASAALMPLDSDPDQFTWREEDVSLGTWVSQFGSVTAEGLVQARVTRYTEEGEWKGGAALLKFTPQGATVSRWVHPLQANPPQISMANDPAGVAEPSTEAVSGFPLTFSIAMEYSEKAYQAIQASGGKLRASLIVDQYGPQFMEEEAIAVLDETFAPGEVLKVSGIPFSEPGYRVNPGKRYKLTVMILPGENAVDDFFLEAYSADGAADWDTAEIQGRTLAYQCKLGGEEGEPAMSHTSGGTDSPPAEDGGLYNPFADVDMDEFFAE